MPIDFQNPIALAGLSVMSGHSLGDALAQAAQTVQQQQYQKQQMDMEQQKTALLAMQDRRMQQQYDMTAHTQGLVNQAIQQYMGGGGQSPSMSSMPGQDSSGAMPFSAPPQSNSPAPSGNVGDPLTNSINSQDGAPGQPPIQDSAVPINPGGGMPMGGQSNPATLFGLIGMASDPSKGASEMAKNLLEQQKMQQEQLNKQNEPALAGKKTMSEGLAKEESDRQAALAQAADSAQKYLGGYGELKNAIIRAGDVTGPTNGSSINQGLMESYGSDAQQGRDSLTPIFANAQIHAAQMLKGFGRVSNLEFQKAAGTTPDILTRQGSNLRKANALVPTARMVIQQNQDFQQAKQNNPNLTIDQFNKMAGNKYTDNTQFRQPEDAIIQNFSGNTVTPDLMKQLTIPQDAIKMLKQNPNLAPAFQQKYGVPASLFMKGR